jgi:hypothetical protein
MHYAAFQRWNRHAWDANFPFSRGASSPVSSLAPKTFLFFREEEGGEGRREEKIKKDRE